MGSGFALGFGRRDMKSGFPVNDPVNQVVVDKMVLSA